ncbi:glycerophosphodiester phosphodiesterase [Halorubrum sp. Boch-26]|uniref:glycerophosphodiester phosphodiesterase n=1 Tax=Halorubrum sp. Boch-26 TaxID=2994426 RepID=UPI0024695A07|nr:glycerophosphodiester phosphodiesterase [Halorubrum sp. Boch-26]
MTGPDDERFASTDRSAARRRTLLRSTAGVAATGVLGAAYADGGTRSADADARRDAVATRTRDGADGAIDARPPGELTLIAHRGFAGENPENTVAAAEAATSVGGSAGDDTPAGRGADIIELDVVPTADGDIVVFHDDALSGRDGGRRGLTDTEGVVWETDTATVTSAEVLDSGETVPRLSRFLDAVPGDVGVNVELKNPGRADLRFAEKLSEAELADRTAVWLPFVERVVDVLVDHDNEFLCSSFCEGALAAIREVSSYAVAPILWESIGDGLAIAREHDAAAVHAPMQLIDRTPFHDPALTAGVDLVALAHAEGRDVNVWTVDTWYQAERLAEAGVDGIAADYSNLLSRATGASTAGSRS